MPQGYSNAFRAPMRAEIDRDVYSNALQKNQVARLPQANRAQDLEIERFEQVTGQQRQEAARKFLGDVFTGIAQSQDPLGTGRTILGNSSFQAALRDVGMDPAQFTIDATDTPESLQKQSADLARVFGGGAVNRLENPNIPSNVRVAEYYAGLPQEGSGVTRSIFNEANRAPTIREIAGVPTNIGPGAAATPLSNQQSEIDFAANRKRAETEAVQSVVPADARAAAAAKSPRLAAAARRLDRVAQASAALGTGGGPLEGRARGVVGTPAAQELEAANAQLLGELTALTRVPGVGSQSDLEQRLKQLELPNATQHPSVRARSIQELEAFMNDLGAALDSVSGGPSNNDPLGIRGNP